jgi:hypothetical protein
MNKLEIYVKYFFARKNYLAISESYSINDNDPGVAEHMLNNYMDVNDDIWSRVFDIKCPDGISKIGNCKYSFANIIYFDFDKMEITNSTIELSQYYKYLSEVYKKIEDDMRKDSYHYLNLDNTDCYTTS